MQSQALFIIGAPRSGTTFLCQVLNQHPLIHISNESRVFVFLKDVIERESARPHLIGRDYRAQFVDFVLASAGEWVERFYRDGLGVHAPIWGDKHPPYADPALLSGRDGSTERLPRSGSSLRLIGHCLPGAKFIHIHRDPRQVAHSLVQKGWTPSMVDGVNVWQQYVAEIVEFFGELPARQHFTIGYRDLLEEPEAAADALGVFMDLHDAGPIRDFLRAQQHSPTPFSDPVTDLSQTYRVRAARNDNQRVLALAGATAERLGYD